MSNYRNDAQDGVKIGLNTDISISGFNGDNPIRAKVDTGAQYCSLHASDLEVSTDEITRNSIATFTYNEYKYKMNVAGFQAVSSADGGTTNRPSIKLNVRINEQFIPDIVFNLNDRSNMDFPILIGMNLIEAGKFVIDPSLTEMEVSFGPEGSKVINSDETPDITPPVDNDGISSDNSTNGDLSLEDFLRSIMNRPFADVIIEIQKAMDKLKEDPDDRTKAE